MAERQCHTITTDPYGVDATTAYGSGHRPGFRNPVAAHTTAIRGPFKLTIGYRDSSSLRAIQSCQELLSLNHP